MIWTNDHTHWGLISILIHWMTAVIVFGLFGLGLWMVELDYYHEWYRKGPNLHKSMGVLLLMLTLFRLLWVSVQSRPLPLEHYTPIEKRLSKWGGLIPGKKQILSRWYSCYRRNFVVLCNFFWWFLRSKNGSKWQIKCLSKCNCQANG